MYKRPIIKPPIWQEVNFQPLKKRFRLKAFAKNRLIYRSIMTGSILAGNKINSKFIPIETGSFYE